MSDQPSAGEPTPESTAAPVADPTLPPPGDSGPEGNAPLPAGGSPSLSPIRIVAAVVVAVALAWTINSNMPQWFEVPEHLMGLDETAPRDVLQEFDQESARVHRSNGLVYFSVLGVSLGLIPLMLACCAPAGRAVLPALAGIIGGGLFGPLAYYAGRAVRRYVDSGAELPMLGDAREGMAGDMLVVLAASVVVTLPVFIGMLCMALPGIWQKAISVPLAGVLAGLLFPIAATYIMPDARTSTFPLTDPKVMALWLGLLGLLVIVLLITTGDRKPARSAPPAPDS